MGMDVYSEKGVIASIDDLVGMLRKKDIPVVADILRSHAEDYRDENIWPEITSLSLATKPTLEQIQEALKSLVVVHGSPSKYGSDDCYLEHDEDLLRLWADIITLTRPELPHLNEARVFDSGRLNGWDVPHGEACFIFSSDECFETRMTEKGKMLKKAIGHCTETEWTIMSV